MNSQLATTTENETDRHRGRHTNLTAALYSFVRSFVHCLYLGLIGDDLFVRIGSLAKLALAAA